MAELTSKAYPSAGFHAVQDLFLQRGWGDGLPVIPPTPDLVGAFVDAVELAADDVIGTIPEQGRDITVEKLAINAVAAGCREEYMSVLVATAARCQSRSSTCTPRRYPGPRRRC